MVRCVPHLLTCKVYMYPVAISVVLFFKHFNFHLGPRNFCRTAARSLDRDNATKRYASIISVFHRRRTNNRQ